MFKKYDVYWEVWKGERKHTKHLAFYFQSKRNRKGRIFHRAVAIGDFPRIDSTKQDYEKYLKNSEKLENTRKAKARLVPGGALVLERWVGRHVLCKLWDKLANLSFIDMHMISERCPFNYDKEPQHEDIVEPEDVFN